MTLLTESQPKLEKGEELGYLSFGLHFAPAAISGYQVCASSSMGCRDACLYTSGHGRFTRTQEARIRKTIRFFAQRAEFMETLVKNIKAALRRAERLAMTPCFRLNLTSDVRWETVPVNVDGVWYDNIMNAFPTVQFYDYTKHTNRRNIPANYHLTFSRSEENEAVLDDMFAQGYNVAIVFDIPKSKSLPDTYMGRPVIDGRTHDLRFIDPQGVWVGLSALGEAKVDESGFVVSYSNMAA
jgi:hypothetical protein